MGDGLDMVSIMIGKRGSQIKQLQEQTRTEIFISSMKYQTGALRSAQVKGNCAWELGREGEKHCGRTEEDVWID